MSQKTLSALELETLVAWKTWGHAWSMFTACSCCGIVKKCRGRRRARMLCLECFDLEERS